MMENNMSNISQISDYNDDATNKPVCPTCYTSVAIYLTIIGVVALIGNSLMVILLLKPQFRQPVNFLIFNCLLSNLIEVLIGLPMIVASNFVKRWMFGSRGCVFYGFLMYTVILNNMVTLTSIGVYRYISVFHKQGKRLKQKSLIVKIIVFSWAYSLVWSCLPLFGWGSYGLDRLETTCAIKWEADTLAEQLYLSSMFIFVLILPMSIITMAYVKIFRRIVLQLHSHVYPADVLNTRPDRHKCVDSDGRTRKLKIEIVLTKIIAANAILFCVAWMPYGILSFISAIGVRLSVEVMVVPLVMAKSQCAFTPIIYFCAHKQYRRAVLISLRLRKSDPPEIDFITNSIDVKVGE